MHRFLLPYAKGSCIELACACHVNLRFMIGVALVQDRAICILVAVVLPVLAVGAQKDFDYPTLWDPSTIVSNTVEYADGSAKLKVGSSSINEPMLVPWLTARTAF